MSNCDLNLLFFFFFKQKTAYEMRISDWSSDVCSSDLIITDQGTPDYGDHNGPYGPMYKAMHTNGKALVSKPSPPSLFAKALYETASEKIGRASCRERVCQYV